MATDETLNNADSEGREVWAPLHAWRVLGILRAEEAVVPLLGLLRRVDEEDDDWVEEDLPGVLAQLGPAMLPPARAYLADATHGERARMAAADAIKSLGMAQPEQRGACVAVLARQLERFADQSDALNGFLILYLLDLKGVEAAPAMEKAFAGGHVDETCAGDWEDVQVALGVKAVRETPRRANELSELADKLRAEFFARGEEPNPFFIGSVPVGGGVLHFSEGARAGQIWLADLWCCSDPMCGCWHVNFECRPQGADRAAPLCFTLDVRERKWVPPPEDVPMSPKEKEFARCVVGAFRKQDWNRLGHYLEEDRQLLLETMEISDLAGQFPKELKGAASVRYQEVFPFAHPFFFEYEGREWGAVESYCINPACSCQDVVFTIFRLDDGTGGPTSDAGSAVRVRYDYRTGQETVGESGLRDAPPVPTLMARLKEAYPELPEVVSERHANLRFLVEHAGGQPARREEAKVGRNDPCPCGSGKKYKKCCGK